MKTMAQKTHIFVSKTPNQPQNEKRVLSLGQFFKDG
jgi:hypothetical protein